jgi:omega-hydroxy-beta-dihydromenaquinone-9 sulfotransferase
MFFDFRNYLRFFALSFFKPKQSLTPLSLRRLFFLGLFFIFFPIFQLFNFFCFILDDLFFPGYRKIELKPPVFIIGNPRSGTTFMHRLMAKDTDCFFYFKTWEIIFPAIIQKKFFCLIDRIDCVMGGYLGKVVRHFEVLLLGNFLRKHPTGLFYPEEDEILLIHIFSSVYLMFFFPLIEEISDFVRFDQSITPENKQRIMTFYKNCIKRQAYYKGGKTTLLSKNPAFSSKVDTLYRYFPDCNIIYMLRNPLDVIPSMISEVLTTCIYPLNQTGPLHIFQTFLYETACFFYEYPLSILEEVSNETYLLINYDEFIMQPSKKIQEIYNHFNFDLTPGLTKALDKEEGKAKTYQSKHFYSLDQYRLSREKIVSDFNFIFEQFGFDKREKEGLNQESVI